MKDKKSFEDVYSYICNNSSEIDPELEAAKKERVLSNKIKFIVCLAFDIAMLYFLIMFFRNVGFLTYSFLFVFFIILLFVVIINGFICLVIGVILNGKQKKYNYKFKEVIVKRLIENFYDNTEYYPNKGIPERIYKDAKYNEYYDEFYSEDYIEARVDNTYDIDIAEVRTEKIETYEDSDGKTKTRLKNIFDGMFAKIVLDKSINDKIIIAKNNKLFFDDKRQKMDFNEFEKYFDVAASNKLLVMRILTPDIMLELLNFLNNYNVMFDIIIDNYNIYIRFYCGNMFESSNLKKGAIDKDTLNRYYNILEFSYNLSHKLINIIKEVDI